MPIAKAVPISDALDAMRDSDDSIAEIDAMIPRLLKMKKQLIAQKEYIEVAVKDSQEPKNGNAQNARAIGRGGLVVDYRVKLYKHQSKIQRLQGDGSAGLTDGSLAIAIADGAADDAFIDTSSPETAAVDDADEKRSVKSGGTAATAADIFKIDQKIVPETAVEATDEEQVDNIGTPVFASVDLECTKKFLIGVNAILTHPNDIETTGAINGTVTHTLAIGDGSTTAEVATADNNINKGTYSAGGRHLLTSGILRCLLMQGNKNVTAATLSTALTKPAVAGSGGSGPADRSAHYAAMKALRGFGL